MVIKNELWQEVRAKQNYWPYVIPLKETYLFSDVTSLDLTIPVESKSPYAVRKEIDLLVANAIRVGELNANAIVLDPNCPKFPVNGSASRVNKICEKLILEGKRTAKKLG